MRPVEFYLTAYMVYLGKAPLLVQYIAPEQGCLIEAGQLYSSPLLLDKTWNNPDSGQANTDTPLWPAMVTNGTVRLIKVAIVQKLVQKLGCTKVDGWYQSGDQLLLNSHSLKIANHRGSLFHYWGPHKRLENPRAWISVDSCGVGRLVYLV